MEAIDFTKPLQVSMHFAEARRIINAHIRHHRAIFESDCKCSLCISAHLWLAALPTSTPNPLQCLSISPKGKRCGLPKNHTGNHHSGMSDRNWTDAEQANQSQATTAGA